MEFIRAVLNVWIDVDIICCLFLTFSFHLSSSIFRYIECTNRRRYTPCTFFYCLLFLLNAHTHTSLPMHNTWCLKKPIVLLLKMDLTSANWLWGNLLHFGSHAKCCIRTKVHNLIDFPEEKQGKKQHTCTSTIWLVWL